MTFRVQLLSLLALMATAWAAPAANAATSFSLVDPQFTLAPGKLEGRSSILLSIAGASEEEIAGKPENIVDLRVDNSVQGAVSFTATPLFGSAKERKWLLTGEIKDLPLDTVQKRYLKFSFDGQDVVLAYAVSNKGTSNTPFSWTVNLPSGEMSLPEGQPVQLTISVGSVPATKTSICATPVCRTVATRARPGREVVLRPRERNPDLEGLPGRQQDDTSKHDPHFLGLSSDAACRQVRRKLLPVCGGEARRGDLPAHVFEHDLPQTADRNRDFGRQAYCWRGSPWFSCRGELLTTSCCCPRSK